MSIPNFAVHITVLDGAPHIITVRPIWPGNRPPVDDFVAARAVASTIQNEVISAVHQYNRWNPQRILTTVNGIMNANNVDNGDTQTFDEFQNLLDVNFETILDIIEKIQTSNQTIRIYHLEWQFTIDIDSIRDGGAPGKLIVPSWAGKIHFRDTWKDNGVNCAAYAIVRLMNKFIEHPKRYDMYPQVAVQDAIALQEQLRWGDFVDTRDLCKFVNAYPDYRLVVLTPPGPCPVDNFIGKTYEYAEDRNIIYLFYDASQRHYAACGAPQAVVRGLQRGALYRWCHRCTKAFLNTHECFGVAPPSKRTKKKCACGLLMTKDHLCGVRKCNLCSVVYKEGRVKHRCILFKKKRSEEKNQFVGDDDQREDLLDGSIPALLVYDLEARVNVIHSVKSLIQTFNMTANHQYSTDMVSTWDHSVSEHVANLVVVKNVFTGEEQLFEGDRCLINFLTWLFAYNQGNNICLAHNAAGYDTRLLFSCLKIFTPKTPDVIMRGAKIMQMKIDRLVFRDTMLHVKGSLKNLAKENGCIVQKGYYPHLFNTTNNYTYVGPIPGKEYFDLSLMCKSVQDYQDFNEWHNGFNGIWDNRKMLIDYCVDDVRALSEIAKGYHKCCFDMTGMTPWMNATAPSFCYESTLIEACEKINLPEGEERNEVIQNLALNEFWAVLKPWEYTFARRALRGGRTEIKNMYYQLTEEEWDRGVRIRYQDVNSLYPYQQIVRDFPVGTPTIFAWDLEYYPCMKHDTQLKCSCPYQVKGDRFLRIVNCFAKPQWTAEEILAQDNFFGIVCATLIPPKDLFHPVLVCWNEELKKCVASLRDEDHVEITITSIEFIQALKKGYKLVKIHAYHKYNKRSSLWRESTMKQYLEKMLNSKPAPENREAFMEKWDEAFPGMRKLMEGTWDKWGKFPAKKQTAKILMNSGWGKHAQRIRMTETKVYSFKEQREQISDLFQNYSSGALKHKAAIPFNEDTVVYQYELQAAQPNLHEGYLPAAEFVPAYGRMQLWEQLDLLGDRVLMCDTDSIVYIYDPQLYNIPQGDMAGQWEVEDVDSKHGIMEFVGWGPKTYSLKCRDGYEVVKAKGLSLNYATQLLLNHDVMKREVIKFLETGKMDPLFIPQVNFEWNISKSMRTVKNLKQAKISRKEMKGELKGSLLYPFGYV